MSNKVQTSTGKWKTTILDLIIQSLPRVATAPSFDGSDGNASDSKSGQSQGDGPQNQRKVLALPLLRLTLRGEPTLYDASVRSVLLTPDNAVPCFPRDQSAPANLPEHRHAFTNSQTDYFGNSVIR